MRGEVTSTKMVKLAPVKFTHPSVCGETRPGDLLLGKLLAACKKHLEKLLGKLLGSCSKPLGELLGKLLGACRKLLGKLLGFIGAYNYKRGVLEPSQRTPL
jgi:hypothetical protein